MGVGHPVKRCVTKNREDKRSEGAWEDSGGLPLVIQLAVGHLTESEELPDIVIRPLLV